MRRLIRRRMFPQELMAREKIVWFFAKRWVGGSAGRAQEEVE